MSKNEDYTECARCAEYAKLLRELHYQLASILPLISNQESYAANAVRHCIDKIKNFGEEE